MKIKLLTKLKELEAEMERSGGIDTHNTYLKLWALLPAVISNLEAAERTSERFKLYRSISGKHAARDMLELLVLWAWQGIHISLMRGCEILKISYYEFVDLQQKHGILQQIDIEEHLKKE